MIALTSEAPPEVFNGEEASIGSRDLVDVGWSSGMSP